ncbi:hypothetical protein GF324_09205 [bacterium]|nr:hypothetical protein [bacterium]
MVKSNTVHVLHGTRPVTALLLGVAVLALGTGCMWEPDRDNPADPGSDRWYAEGGLSVHVRTYTGEVLPGARVTLPATGMIDTTDQLGWSHFAVPIESLSDTVRMRAMLDGYTSKDTTTVVQYGDETSVIIDLNAVPVIDSVRIVSGYEDVSASDPYVYRLIVRAWVRDPAGEQIDRVVFRDYDGSEPVMTSQNGSNLYTYSLALDTLGSDSLIALRVGRPMAVYAFDRKGAADTLTATLNSFLRYDHLEEDMSILFSPIDPDDPVFYWSFPDDEFIEFRPIRYKFELYNEETPVVDSLMLVDENRIELDLNEPLQGVDHQWRLTLYDPHGSYSRSPFLQVQVRQP